MHGNTCLCTYLYCVGTHHGNVLKSLSTRNTVTYFIPRAHRSGGGGGGGGEFGEDLGKMKVIGPWGWELRQGRKWAKHTRLYYNLLQDLKEKTCQRWLLNRKDLNFCVHSIPLQSFLTIEPGNQTPSTGLRHPSSNHCRNL